MAPSNHEIAQLLETLAFFLEIEGENPHKIRAYKRAARTIRGLDIPLRDAIAGGEDITSYPGIGKAIEKKIREIISSGTLKKLEVLRHKYPPGLMELTKLPGIGPKKALQLYREFNIKGPEDLLKFIEQGDASKVKGMGPVTQKRIFSHLKRYFSGRRLFPFSEAEEVASQLKEDLEEMERGIVVKIAGSIRRKKEMVSDVDILVSRIKVEELSHLLKRYTGDKVSISIEGEGIPKLSMEHPGGIPIEIRVVSPDSLGVHLLRYTGNIEFCKAIFSLLPGEEHITSSQEEEIFSMLNIPIIPPEIREGKRALEVALQGRLPSLVEEGDIRGDLHVHTTWSDGKNSIEEMALAAMKRGYEYIGITDHSQRMRMVNGLDERRLMAQMEEIDRLNSSLRGIRILKGIEVDILEDGSLDLSAEILRMLDYVIGSIHSHFNLDRTSQTRRIIRAMESGLISILGHPSGRLLGKRAPLEIEMEEVFRAAEATGCIMEINSQPHRLDLNDKYLRRAKEMGIKVCINSDAHNTFGLSLVRFGINQARRGWIEGKDTINTRPLEEVLSLLSPL